MRNEKKYNKSIYFTMVFVQTIIHLVVLSEIFLKLFLIDHIVYDASSKIIIMDFYLDHYIVFTRKHLTYI